MKKPQKKQTVNKWIVFASLPAQIGGIIYLFYWIGMKVDAYYGWEAEYATKGSTLLGVFLAMYQVINEVKKVSKNE